MNDWEELRAWLFYHLVELKAPYEPVLSKMKKLDDRRKAMKEHLEQL